MAQILPEKGTFRQASFDCNSKKDGLVYFSLHLEDVVQIYNWMTLLVSDEKYQQKKIKYTSRGV